MAECSWKTGSLGRVPPIAAREDAAIADDHDRRIALTLHIGTGKTGSTSLQVFLRQSRFRLADAGWLYPRSTGPGRHAHFGVWIRPDDEVAHAFRTGHPGTRGFDTVEDLRREVPRRLLAEARRAGLRRVLMSDEGLWQSSEPALARLRKFADAHASDVRLVCYLRRQDDHLVSRYQQAVKHGETRTLAQRVTEIDLDQTYDYYARLQTWLRIVEPAELVVRRFERHRMLNNSLYDDFVDAAGLGITPHDLPPRDRNESLDSESVEFLRLLNLYRAERGDEAEDVPKNRALFQDLRALDTGPSLTLPEAELDRFMGRWTDSNERVARELLAEPDTRLFAMPRKSGNTTTEQRLEPARLEEYLAALPQVPGRLAAPLRRIAERESAAR